MAKSVRKINFKGLKKDKKDNRDFLLQNHPIQKKLLGKQLPNYVDLVTFPGVPEPHYNQLQTGSCTGQAGAFVYWFEQRLETPELDWSPSRLMVYYNARRLEGTTRDDAGATIRDTLKGLDIWGVCPETDWPFNPRKLTTSPDAHDYAIAKTHQVKNYWRLRPKLKDLKTCLASNHPFIFGILVTESMMDDIENNNGVITWPIRGEELGGHAVVAIGYHDDKKWFKIRNSWGPKVGDNGDIYLPYRYMQDKNLVWDIWSIRDLKGA